MFFDDLAASSRTRPQTWVKDSLSRVFRGNSVLCMGGGAWEDIFKSVFQIGRWLDKGIQVTSGWPTFLFPGVLQ